MTSSIKLFLALAASVAAITVCVFYKLDKTTFVLKKRENSIDHVYLHSNLTTTITPNVQPLVKVSLEESISEDMKRCSFAMGVSPNVLEQNKYNIASIAKKAAFFLETFWEIVPKDYLSNYKNPCWYSNVTISTNVSKFLREKLPAYKNKSDIIPQSDILWLLKELFETPTQGNQTLQCLPYFLLPGIPKSGTTTLHSTLSQHPQIIKPNIKEPQWWHKLPVSPPASKKYMHVIAARYLSNFLYPSSEISGRKDGGSLVTYDASQAMMVNLHDSGFHINHEDYCAFPAVISRVLPKAKIIVLMRDPVPRAYSHHLFMNREWPIDKKQDPALYFEKHIQKAVNEFQQCVRNNSIYECVNKVRTDFKQLSMWLGSGVYHIHIQKWMQFWPKEQFILLKTEKMALKPVSTLKKITDFLSLDPFPEKIAVNATKERKRVNNHKREMLLSTKKLLQSFYQPFNKKLEKLFGINWKYDH